VWHWLPQVGAARAAIKKNNIQTLFKVPAPCTSDPRQPLLTRSAPAAQIIESGEAG
jgi:hypothetical protein